MINRAVKGAKLDEFVEAFAARIAAFDRQALKAAKSLSVAAGFLRAATWRRAIEMFFESLT